MRAYEVVYIITPNLDQEAIDNSTGWLKSTVEQYGGQVDKVDVWGKRRLAYEIDDYQEGIYILANITAAKEATDELERGFKIRDEVLRYLLTRKDS